MNFIFRTSRILFIICAFLLSTEALSKDKLSVEQFAELPKWKKLLHLKNIDQDAISDNQSYLTSDSFYLNKQRADTTTITPIEELKATITALYLPASAADNATHAQCLFPARAQLIAEQLDLSPYGEFPQVDCLRYQEWQQSLSANSISIVFASGYMSNPASMYGHLFLKINNDKSEKSDLLNNSLNYGAIVPNSENPIVYVVKGIFGGYKAAFSDQQFYLHNHNYGEVELRDMWEYKLNISQADTKFITAHIWELLNNRFDYYFVDENCAYHIAKLLELVLDKPLITQDSLWVIPSSVAKQLDMASYQNQALTKEIVFLPSRETLLHDFYQQLSKTMRKNVESLIVSDFDFSIASFQALNNEQQAQVIESLFQYVHVIEQKGLDKSVTKPIRKKLALARLKLPSGRVLKGSAATEKKAPHLGMEPSKFSSGVINTENNGSYLTGGFRMTYFDDVSTSIGRAKFSNLEMIDLEFIANQDELHLYRFDIVDIDSLYLPATPWTDESASAWSVRFGYEQLNNSCFNCGIYFAEGDYGRSMLFTSDSLGYAMIGAKGFVGENEDIHLSAKLGLISEITEQIKIKIEFKQWQDFRFEQTSWTSYRGEINYHFAHDWELRAHVDHNEETLAALKINYFWDF